jgi:hypothetical protein
MLLRASDNCSRMAPMTATQHSPVRSLVSVAVASALTACGASQTPSAQAPTATSATASKPSGAGPSAAPQAAAEAGCSLDHWCLATGIPKQLTLSAIWGASPEDIWAAGEGGTLLHWNGTNWSAVASGTQSALRVIAGTSAKSVWAAGLDGTLLHFDGSTWSRTKPDGTPWSPLSGANSRPMYALFADASDELWAGGSGLRRFDGKSWSHPFHPSHMAIMAIWGADSSHTWAIGSAGTLRLWDGHAWMQVPHDQGPDFFGIWGSAVNDVWIVGSAGAILHWDESRWAASPSGTTNDLRAVHGFSAHDAWSVGDQGTILHWQGSAWQASGSPSHKALLGAGRADGCRGPLSFVARPTRPVLEERVA